MEHLNPGVARRIKLAAAIGFSLVLVVGGLSVLLAWTLTRQVEQGKQTLQDMEQIDQIHALLHHFLGDVYLVVSNGRALVETPPENALKRLKSVLEAHEAADRAEQGRESRQELAQLEQFKALLAELETVSLRLLEASARGQAPAPVELAALNELAYRRAFAVLHQLHVLHEKKIRRSVAQGHQRMRVISAFYAMFAAAGVLLLLFGNRVLFRTLIVPITRLAEAAVRISGGDLSQRVPVRSGDEVGQLSRAFNLMAERLQAHEAERLNFQSELERQVSERTRELQEATARLKAAQARLIRAERIAITGQIAAGVTHEIRTPLNSLGINVQLLHRDLAKASPPPFREMANTLATVEYEITRINRILDEFVSFARLPAPQFVHVEVVALVGEVLRFLHAQAAEAGVRIEPPVTQSGVQVKGDRDQFRQVFLNLAQNALQAMPNGGVLGVEVAEKDGWVEIAVTDSGPGIPEEERERIFIPFISTKPGGLGLGLAIVRRIVEEHGGSVCCQKGTSVGARFVVRLPVAPPLDGNR